ncbi:hypothetical protein [Variovorax sp. V15]|uniref:hypothetical protein n=1 Tax=Variovorax sp. V15 TaxID=3065952 RepID=UPI0034E85626
MSLVLALTLASANAQGCSRVIQITLDFQEDSAQLESKQILRLARWLVDVRGLFQYGDADVEGVAVGNEAGKDRKELARRRADAAASALKTAGRFAHSFQLERLSDGLHPIERKLRRCPAEPGECAGLQSGPDTWLQVLIELCVVSLPGILARQGCSGRSRRHLTGTEVAFLRFLYAHPTTLSPVLTPDCRD